MFLIEHYGLIPISRSQSKINRKGGRPTSLDKPICLSSIVNNVGFKLVSTEIKKPNIVEQLNLPF